MLRRIVPRRGHAGVTLIEMMIGIAIVTFLMLLAAPSFGIFLQNTQIRNAAETTLAGITLARAEAIRRNASVRFQLVSSLASGCALNAGSLNWIVSLEDPSGACEVAPSETTAPQIVQKKSALEGSPNGLVSTVGGALLVFNGLGRVSGAGIQQINISSTSGACEHVDPTNGTMRCLAILVSPGGQTKLCDPKVTDTADPRHCS